MKTNALAIKTQDKLTPFNDLSTYKIPKNYNIKKQGVIKEFINTKGNITKTCKLAHVDRKTFYKWLKEDRQFAKYISFVEAGINDEMRSILLEEAEKRNLTAIIFYLKSRHPDFKNQGNTNIQINFIKEQEKELKEYSTLE